MSGLQSITPLRRRVVVNASRVTAANARYVDARQKLAAAVMEAREYVSDREIGEWLGITSEGVAKRYGRRKAKK